VRAAARGLARARAATAAAADPALPHLQVCLAVAGKYFGQGGPEEDQ
jgi:survival of motor neuron protein-interacting protein 1